MLWGPRPIRHYKYFHSFTAGLDFRRQNLTSKDGPRTERVKRIIYLNSVWLKYLCDGSRTQNVKVWAKFKMTITDHLQNVLIVELL